MTLPLLEAARTQRQANARRSSTSVDPGTGNSKGRPGAMRGRPMPGKKSSAANKRLSRTTLEQCQVGQARSYVDLPATVLFPPGFLSPSFRSTYSLTAIRTT